MSVVKFLLELKPFRLFSRIDPDDIQNSRGETPLMVTARLGNIELLDLLLKRGSSVR